MANRSKNIRETASRHRLWILLGLLVLLIVLGALAR
jgi:hypothetical protein